MSKQSIFVSAVIALSCTLAIAQVEVDTVIPVPVEGGFDQLISLQLPPGLAFQDLDEQTRKRYIESLSQYFQYNISAYQHREKVFAWQHFSSQIIFVVVFILVGVGIYFSWLQFRQSLESRRTKAAKQARQSKKVAKEPDDIEVKGMEATQLEISTKGIKVSSSVLGVIILVISLLFFYLYLVHVYPIREIQ